MSYFRVILWRHRSDKPRKYCIVVRSKFYAKCHTDVAIMQKNSIFITGSNPPCLILRIRLNSSFRRILFCSCHILCHTLEFSAQSLGVFLRHRDDISLIYFLQDGAVIFPTAERSGIYVGDIKNFCKACEIVAQIMER